MAVALVCMPYVSIKRPSLALGLLRATLGAAGIHPTVEYLNLEFARRVGIERYGVANSSTSVFLLGEWTFADTPGDYLPTISDSPGLRGFHTHEDWNRIVWDLRREAPAFIDECARRLIHHKIVACTSTFQQNMASLALLKRVKELSPTTLTVMGGANCEGPMGLALMRNHPFLDYVVSGEADELVTPFFRALLEGGEIPYGVISRPLPEEAPRATVKDLANVPCPDFDDYFEALEKYGLQQAVRPALTVENSRGCWWGAKHHCTFCGLNGHGMSYRSKPGERAAEEMRFLAARHGVKDFMVADNILDPAYFKTFLPLLNEDRFEIFYETKANLKRPQLELLAKAGVSYIQPGLESLSDELLALMDKGTTALQNLQTLKWSRELGINVTWLMLFAFPGDRLEWYQDMTAMIPWLTHLQPPQALIRVGYHRFSPYFERAGDYGLEPIPEPAYPHVYDLPAEELQQLAYFFVDRGPSQNVDAIADVLRDPVLGWMDTFWDRRPVLCFEDDGETLEVFDTRPAAPQRRSFYTGAARQVLLETGIRAENASEEVLADLARRGLILRQKGRYLTLGCWGDPPRLRRYNPQGTLSLLSPPSPAPTGPGCSAPPPAAHRAARS